MNIHDIEIKSVSLSFGYKNLMPNDLSIQVEIMDAGEHKSLDLWMTFQESGYILKKDIYNQFESQFDDQFKSQFDDFFKEIYINCPIEFKSKKKKLIGHFQGGVNPDNKLKLNFVFWEGLD